MTSHQLIHDETARQMTAALRHLSCGCLDNERERRGAYREAGVRPDDMAQLDAEALKRERVRRRLFGLPAVALSVLVPVQHAAATSLPLCKPVDCGRNALLAFEVLGVEAVAVAGVLLFAWLAVTVRNAMARNDRRRAIRRYADPADEIWS